MNNDENELCIVDTNITHQFEYCSSRFPFEIIFDKFTRTFIPFLKKSFAHMYSLKLMNNPYADEAITKIINCQTMLTDNALSE